MEKLTAEDLSLWYGRTPVLHRISVSFRARELTALLGPSGCGKSTLLRVFNRMHPPGVSIAGRVLLDGQDLLDPKLDLPALRRQVGMVLQTPAAFPMSVYQNVAYGVRLHESLSRRELDARVEGALRDAALFDELKDRLHQNAASLSGGQQQRLCIARALAVRPQVLLLDEPTSALDPLSTQRIEELLLRLKRDYTILLVTHNPAQARRVADAAVLMKDGVIVSSGRVRSVLTHG